MPKKPSALTLKHCALNCVALNCETICYGYKESSKELAKFINDEGFLEVEGPFVVKLILHYMLISDRNMNPN